MYLYLCLHSSTAATRRRRLHPDPSPCSNRGFLDARLRGRPESGQARCTPHRSRDIFHAAHMHHRTVRGLIRLLLAGVLLAAGTPAQADTTPASFDFVNVTVSDKQVVESNVVTVRGIDEPTPILISGHSSGRFRINNGEWRSAPATVNAGDRIRLRLISRAMGNAGVNTLSVDIGGVTDSWRVTTPTPGVPPPADKVFNLGGTSAEI